MKKTKFAVLSLLALSLVAANTAMAKSDNSNHHKQGMKSESKMKRHGLDNALDHVKKEQARAAIQRAKDKKKHKHNLKHKNRQHDYRYKVITAEQIVAADKAALTIGFTKGDNANSVHSPLALPVNGAKGSVITWISSHPAIISNDGKTINRPTIGQGNAAVTLIATLSSNGVTDTKLFSLVVKPQLTDADKVASDKAALDITYTNGDSATNVTSKLTLPALGKNGSTITWVSTSPTLITNDGKTITRPAVGQGDAPVILIATINSNGITDLQTFSVIVKQQLTDAQKVIADKAALQIGYHAPDTSASVTSKLTLPAVGLNGSTILWYSSNSALITDNGTVIRPVAASGHKSVTLNALIISNGSIENKTFTVTVKQLS